MTCARYKPGPDGLCVNCSGVYFSHDGARCRVFVPTKTGNCASCGKPFDDPKHIALDGTITMDPTAGAFTVTLPSVTPAQEASFRDAFDRHNEKRKIERERAEKEWVDNMKPTPGQQGEFDALVAGAKQKTNELRAKAIAGVISYELGVSLEVARERANNMVHAFAVHDPKEDPPLADIAREILRILEGRGFIAIGTRPLRRTAQLCEAVWEAMT